MGVRTSAHTTFHSKDSKKSTLCELQLLVIKKNLLKKCNVIRGLWKYIQKAVQRSQKRVKNEQLYLVSFVTRCKSCPIQVSLTF